MASSKQQITNRRHDSIASTISLWDKLPEVNSVNIDIANENDFLDEDDVTENDTEDIYEALNDVSNLPRPLHKGFASSSNLENMHQNTALWVREDYDQVKLIVHKIHAEDIKIELQRRLSSQGIRWMTNDDEQTRSWHFGLSFVRFQLGCSHPIDIIRLITIRSFPFWLKFENSMQRQRRIKSNSERIKPIRYGYSPPYHVSLRYGALTKLNEFYYSVEHSWSNQPKTRWSLFINNDYFGGFIEWVMEECKERKKKQLLAINIDRTIIIHLLPDGFVMYICQTCNMNEFSAKEKTFNNVVRRQHSPPSFPRRLAPMRPAFADDRLPQRSSYEKDKRSGIRNGIYFPTVQFELRIDPNHIANEKAQNTIRHTYKLLTNFFTLHNITICHGMIDSRQGPQVNSFPTLNLPTLIMQYSWQMLVNIGYRLQVQMDQQFCDDLYQLSREKRNADDLFYRVCVYLSRLFTLEPFVNLSEKLHDAVIESKRKREESTFGLINSLDSQTNTETYVPSVTLTPTTIRIKPLKLCRTNRVLRAGQEFGKALEHFALVEIRDENGQRIQSFHFRDLRDLFLDYLKNGFTLMDSNRYYQYLHHSQSQLRVNQFWFYHHEPGINRSFDKAYEWMGTFDKERNIAKYASRIALCFSTTTPTINIDEKNVHYIADIKTKNRKLAFTDGCGTMSEQLRDDINEYNVLKPDEVFIQYTRLNDHEDKDTNNKGEKTSVLHNCKVVVTKNPCYHPGDIRTFTAVNYEELKHLKDVTVFSQQGDCPASHQISGSDLDDDEYAVIWHEDLVPLQTSNAIPYNYDSQQSPPLVLDRPVKRDDINDVVLQIAESDYLGRLSNLHLAYADRLSFS
ncbi:unnamed protein product [Rotaria sordida]|uniref:RNA-dependent RNA polymerase n=1 Tax=Rotaria sordida TaxID=392033 RepID=A0A815M452_9BILA|nr:unnamed protein product [Rotaria sordida]